MHRTWTPRAGGSVCCALCDVQRQGNKGMGMGMGNDEWAGGLQFAVGLFFFLQVTSLCLQPAPHLRLCAVCCASAPLRTFFFLLHIRSTHSSDGTGPELQFAIRHTSCNPIGSYVQHGMYALQCSAVQCSVPFCGACLQPLCLVPSVSLDAECWEARFIRCLGVFALNNGQPTDRSLKRVEEEQMEG